MQISQNLKLKQSQSLVMTPQLQQAIKLLQLTNLELTDLVEKELEENPFLDNQNSEEEKIVSEDEDITSNIMILLKMETLFLMSPIIMITKIDGIMTPTQ